MSTVSTTTKNMWATAGYTELRSGITMVRSRLFRDRSIARSTILADDAWFSMISQIRNRRLRRDWAYHRAKTFRSCAEVYHPDITRRSSLQDVIADSDGRALPPRPVLVTFDDAYASVSEIAAPLCSKFGVPGGFLRQWRVSRQPTISAGKYCLLRGQLVRIGHNQYCGSRRWW